MLDLNLTSTEWMLHDVLAEVLEPPQAVDYLRWATENIVFSKRESPMPGPYNPERFSYFTEILQALSPEDPCRILGARCWRISSPAGRWILILAISSMSIRPKTTGGAGLR